MHSHGSEAFYGLTRLLARYITLASLTIAYHFPQCSKLHAHPRSLDRLHQTLGRSIPIPEAAVSLVPLQCPPATTLSSLFPYYLSPVGLTHLDHSAGLAILRYCHISRLNVNLGRKSNVARFELNCFSLSRGRGKTTKLE